MILSCSSRPWKLTHRSVIGIKRLENPSKINFQAQTGVLFWWGLNRAKPDKVLATEFCVFLTRRWTVTDFWFFGRLKQNISRKKSHPVSRLTIGYPWEEYEKFWIFIMCHIFSIWLGLSGHSLLKFLTWCIKHLTRQTLGEGCRLDLRVGDVIVDVFYRMFSQL